MNLFQKFIYLFIFCFVICDDDIINDEDDKIKEEVMLIQQLEKIINEVEIEYKFKESLTEEEKKLLESLNDDLEINPIEIRDKIKDLIEKYKTIKEEIELEKMTCEQCLEDKKKFEEKCIVNDCNIEEYICEEFCKKKK